MNNSGKPSLARSRNMAAIKGKDTKPELKVRKALHSRGFRYRLHSRSLPGKPDIVLPKYRICIFVHGCFWHRHEGCKYTTTPATRVEFWNAKFLENTHRDRRNRKRLLDSGWSVVELWECGLRKSEPAIDWLYDYIKASGPPFISWPLVPAEIRPKLLF